MFRPREADFCWIALHSTTKGSIWATRAAGKASICTKCRVKSDNWGEWSRPEKNRVTRWLGSSTVWSLVEGRRWWCLHTADGTERRWAIQNEPAMNKWQPKKANSRQWREWKGHTVANSPGRQRRRNSGDARSVRNNSSQLAAQTLVIQRKTLMTGKGRSALCWVRTNSQ